MKHIVIIKESVAKKIAEQYSMTEYKFYSGIKQFLSDLINDPSKAEPNDLLKSNELDRKSLIHLLLKRGIICDGESTNRKINDKDENGNPKKATMRIKYNVPKKDFDRKLKRLYVELFEQNTDDTSLEEATAGGGVGGAVGDFSYDAPVFGDKSTLDRKSPISISITK